jgi:hypothetical protein
MLQIGYARQAITPALAPPVYLAGFDRNRTARSIHDDLDVRALALRLKDTRLVLAALDLLGLPRTHCLEVERRIIERAPGARLILASTHTHHGPDTIGLWGPDLTTSGVNPTYLADLKHRIVETALAALEQSQPVHLRCAPVRVPGVAKNARDLQIVDDELTCAQFCRSEDGEVVATLLDFPCHPEVLWEHNPHITSDYPGFLRREVERETGAPCLFFAGAIGGMMTPDVQEHSFEEAAAMGATLARAALDALSPVKAAEIECLEHRRREFPVPMTNPLFRMAVEAGLLPNILDGSGMVGTEANLLKIGPLWLAGVPGELLPKLGLVLKDGLRRGGAKVAGVVGLANDEVGYILPQEDFVYPEDPFEPGSHYEETMSLGPETGPRLMAALHSLL